MALLDRFQRTVHGPPRRNRRDHRHQHDLRDDREIAAPAERKAAEQRRDLIAARACRRSSCATMPATPNSSIASPPPITPPSSPSMRKWRWNWPAMKPLLAPMKCSTSTIGRLVAIAPRVAKITDSTVAPASGSACRCRRRWWSAPWCACGRSRRDDRRGSRPATLSASDFSAARDRRRRTAASPRSSAAPAGRRAKARCRATARAAAPIPPWCRRGPRRCRDRAGDLDRTRHLGIEVLAVTRAHLDGDLARDVGLPFDRRARTSMTAPVVSEARNVMIATTATSARPAIERFGTIGVSPTRHVSRHRPRRHQLLVHVQVGAQIGHVSRS